MLLYGLQSVLRLKLIRVLHVYNQIRDVVYLEASQPSTLPNRQRLNPVTRSKLYEDNNRVTAALQLLVQ